MTNSAQSGIVFSSAMDSVFTELYQKSGAEKFGISQLTYYTWRKKAGEGARPSLGRRAMEAESF